MIEAAMHTKQIVSSAAYAAWVGAAASAFASITALTVALWGALREDSRRKRLARDQETAFAFGMVGALEMTKRLILQARAEPNGGMARRRLGDVVDHALVIADAALAIQVFDIQMLRDAYFLRGVLHRLRNLLDDCKEGAVSHASVCEIVDPVLNGLLDADDRFFARLPAIGAVRGIDERTLVERMAA